VSRTSLLVAFVTPGFLRLLDSYGRSTGDADLSRPGSGLHPEGRDEAGELRALRLKPRTWRASRPGIADEPLGASLRPPARGSCHGRRRRRLVVPATALPAPGSRSLRRRVRPVKRKRARPHQRRAEGTASWPQTSRCRGPHRGLTRQMAGGAPPRRTGVPESPVSR